MTAKTKDARFELYYSLNQDIAKKDLKRDEKIEIIEAIPLLSDEQRRAIYKLIEEDENLHPSEGRQDREEPYEGKRVERRDVEFDLANFPIRLRRILYKFVKILQKSEQ